MISPNDSVPSCTFSIASFSEQDYSEVFSTRELEDNEVSNTTDKGLPNQEKLISDAMYGS